MRYILENDVLRCEIASHGAELVRIWDKKNGIERLWSGDPAYWNRVSPVLFPFVGGVKNKEYRHEGQTYHIGQHGFARDLEFTFKEQTDKELRLTLEDEEHTHSVYPFCFRLTIGYRLVGSTVTVLWTVENTDHKELYFSIGAHPGFFLPNWTDGGYAFRLLDPNGLPLSGIENRVFGQGGCVTDRTECIDTPNGILPLTAQLFDGDALVLENEQTGSVTLGRLNAAQKEIDTSVPHLTMRYTAPLVGLWSPPHKKAPFVCIEPWYGRCDAESFSGELKDRDYEQVLPAGGRFEAAYEISFG